ncbi:glycoside hydrolase family 9 protein [Ideonella margarita]|uniref:Endoglucanase n=1 Tax=Ideonella margarita TaxID=2984191 RepID=A0ABU9C048_9BURK
MSRSFNLNSLGQAVVLVAMAAGTGWLAAGETPVAAPAGPGAAPPGAASPAPVPSPAPVALMNQLGFLPGASKWAVLPAAAGEQYEVRRADTGRVVLKGDATAAALWAPSGDQVRLADLSAVQAPGRYELRWSAPTTSPQPSAASHSFTIHPKAYEALVDASLKAFYFNRAGTALLPQHAGAWARPAGHPDTRVLVHASAASPGRPAGTVISSPKGWYDAGDYNKYIVNSGISTYTLLAAWEHFPAFFKPRGIGIPETGNGIPDVLNEALWNLDWMLTMQDPADGGVYHKLTDLRFDGMQLPHLSKAERYVVQKSTAATLDFAAVMAVASRVMAKFEAQRPGLSARMLAASRSAWQWAQAHPDVVYRQPADVVTGEYGDGKLTDEYAWAAAELYITTRDELYLGALRSLAPAMGVPGWGDVNGLAWISLAHHRAHLTPAAAQLGIERHVTDLARSLTARWQASAWRLSMVSGDFVWGSNAVALNQAMVLLQGYRLTGDERQLAAAQALLDYVLGRNPMALAMVTGQGTRSPLHPHHRISEGDGVAAPVPGFIVAGPNPGREDQKDCPVPYASAAPAKAYLDHVCSYASNEVAINWNAPLVYVATALQVLTPVQPAHTRRSSHQATTPTLP